MRITTNPEGARVDPGGRLIDHSHPTAVAFAIVGDVVLLAPRSTHAVIFAALKVIDPRSASPIIRNILSAGGPQAVYQDYGLHCFPSPPSARDLMVFAKCDNELGARRSATQAGRAWIGVAVGCREVSIVSWWVKRSQVPPSTIALVLDALGLSGECLLEFQDSETPEAHLIKPKPCSTERR